MADTTLTKNNAPGTTVWIIGLVLAGALWLAIYSQLTDFADAVIGVLGLAHGTRLGEAVHFFSTTRPRCCCC